MEIKNATVVTMGELTKMTTQPLNKNQTMMWVSSIFIIVCSIASIIMGRVVFGCIFLALGLSGPILNFWAKSVLKKKMQNLNNGVQQGVYYEYTFDDLSFKVDVVSGNNTSSNKINYADLFQVQKIENALFMFINPQSAYVVKKEGFSSEEDYNTVVNILTNRTPYIQANNTDDNLNISKDNNINN